jgi:ubiquinone/menaquinone biosynthesis C-methylase UbiE
MHDTHRAYFDSVAETWDVTVPETVALDGIIERFDVCQGDRVLDVGAGTGRLSCRLVEAVGGKGRVVCLDFSGRMLLEARKRGRSGTADLICADVLSLPFVSGYFHKVICFSAFPHFQDKEQALREMQRVMNPRGKLLVVHVASSQGINSIHERIGGVVSNDKLPDASAMHQLIRACGFVHVVITDQPDLYWAEAAVAPS